MMVMVMVLMAVAMMAMVRRRRQGLGGVLCAVLGRGCDGVQDGFGGPDCYRCKGESGEQLPRFQRLHQAIVPVFHLASRSVSLSWTPTRAAGWRESPSKGEFLITAKSDPSSTFTAS